MIDPTAADRERAREILGPRKAELAEWAYEAQVSLIARALAEERERCAKVAEGQKRGRGDLRDDDRMRYFNVACDAIAAAIRKGT